MAYARVMLDMLCSVLDAQREQLRARAERGGKSVAAMSNMLEQKTAKIPALLFPSMVLLE
jgi:hypothetical protein